jgi:hypothetical protein
MRAYVGSTNLVPISTCRFFDIRRKYETEDSFDTKIEIRCVLSPLSSLTDAGILLGNQNLLTVLRSTAFNPYRLLNETACIKADAPSTEAISSGKPLGQVESMTLTRYSDSQNDRSLVHPLLPQPSHNGNDEKSESVKHSPSHCFVVCADTQIGMTSGNKEWETELAYSREAIKMINNLNPRPLFCCMCGDLVGKAKLASCAML